MNRKRIVFMLVFVLLCGLLSGCEMKQSKEGATKQQPISYEMLMGQWKEQAKAETLTCWYTSKTDQTWLESAAKQFEKEYSVKVTLLYYDGINLFEDMNQANQKGEGPDVYLLGNDQLQLATESGMAEENDWFDDAFWSENYPEVAKGAITYQGKQYGYPLYFDTYCLVYDANLLQTAPASIDDILTFLDEYEDTGSTKAIFRWDVADPYINSMFIASYANLFGENGDAPKEFKVNNENCIAAMEYFQSLSAYLWMNKNNISHDTISNRIKDGTLVLGLCKSDILPTLYEMQAVNENKVEQNTENSGDETESESVTESLTTNYQVSYVPSLTQDMSSTTFSTTYSAFVNPYGENTALGNMFGMYLSLTCAKSQYDGNGKLPVVNQKDKFDSMQAVVYAQYLNSKSVPKVMVLGDYLSESGIAFDEIWSGKNAKEQLDLLQQTMEEKIE